MKYQFNEQELLSLFYKEDDDLRPYMAAPYLKNGYVCATEAHILIRIKAETLHGEYKETERCNIDWPADNCNFTISLQEIETMLSNIPQVEEEVKVGEDIKCMECDGEGEVEWEYQDKSGHYHYEDHECPICEGSGFDSESRYVKTGRMIPDGECSIRIRRIVIKAEFLEVLNKAMKIIGVGEVRCVHQDPAKPCIFRVDDNIEIIIMPRLGEAKYHIEGRDAE
ncbi:MAG: hypothetical protein NC226_06500 [Bacteroides cellulosilyticus]|nr:hypothetical protein [Bacteroides cellulosilyticus]